MAAKNALIRAFVAVNVPDQAANELWRYLESIKPLAPLRWVTRAQLHITLQFLGEQTIEAISRIKKHLALLRNTPFDITLSHAGVFPNPKRPRVLWLGVEQGKKELTALANDVNQALKQAAIPCESRSFKPHLTLARMNETPLPEALRAKLATPPPIAWRSSGFELMRSQLTPRGALYSRIPLNDTIQTDTKGNNSDHGKIVLS